MPNAPLPDSSSVRRLPVAVAVLAVILGGCGDGSGTAEPTVTATPDSTPSETAAPSPTDASPTAPATTGTAAPTASASPFPANTEPDSGEPSGDAIAVTDIEVGAHESFDRVVFTIDGGGQAGWMARYVDQARSQGSGSEVAVEGGVVIELVLTNAAYPFDVSPTPVEQDTVDTGPLSTIRDVVNDSIFEGRHLFFVGVPERTPFRVFRLDSPQRVVLDVQHP